MTKRAHHAARRGTAPPSGAAGFTLIEMILALVIFGMIAAVVYSAFYFGHRAVVSGERAADENQRMRLAEELIGRQIRSAVYYYAHHDDDKVPFFFGGSDGMTFITSAPQSAGGAGLAVVTYKLVDGKLVLEERTAFTPDDLYSPPSDAHVERAVLLEGFSRLKFEYLPHEDVDVGWTDKWDAREEDSLPAAVRLTVDGLSFFGEQVWSRDIPLLTIAFQLGNEDREPPEDDDGDDAASATTDNGSGDDATDPDDTDNE
jgi:general secretion pathway protein J